MGVTVDPHSECLHEIDPETGLQKCYLVLPEEDRQNKIRPYRDTYIHDRCGGRTVMGREIAETYQSNPTYYGATMCIYCRAHYPVGPNGEFKWLDGTKVGT